MHNWLKTFSYSSSQYYWPLVEIMLWVNCVQLVEHRVYCFGTVLIKSHPHSFFRLEGVERCHSADSNEDWNCQEFLMLLPFVLIQRFFCRG